MIAILFQIKSWFLAKYFKHEDTKKNKEYKGIQR